MNTITIESTFGEATVDNETGDVQQIDDAFAAQYDPKRFDLKEWKEWQTTLPETYQWNHKDGLLLMEVSFWKNDGTYVAADRTNF